jgi:ubiquinone biosynthesis monooxygenase Coq7
VLTCLDEALRTIGGGSHAGRPRPRPAASEAAPAALSDAERRLSGALMRVNHVGEVCAQALYQAQALTAREPALRAQLEQAAREEADHLAWTQSRLRELGDRPSLLNPIWYAGSFAIGLAAGRLGDAASLGFVVETERQVEQHLAGHLERLPASDLAALYAIWRFFSASDDAAQRTTAYCQRKLEVTGQGCTPQEFTEIERRYAEGSESGGFWDKITDQLAGTFASILKYAAIGGAVLVGTFIVWQAIVGYTAYRTTKAVVSTPEGRRLAGAAVGAAVGGPAGARAGLALASNHRHRRVSRRRRQGGR